MNQNAPQQPQHARIHGRRWPALAALLGIGGMYLLLSDQLSVGPNWLLLSIIVVLLVPITAAVRRRAIHVVRGIGFVLLAIVTGTVIVSTIFLVTRLPGGRTPASTLLLDAALMWCVNVLTFALWYWEMDGGGPVQRFRTHYANPDFVFPQMTLHQSDDQAWAPHFIDYLFLAFNTSTAFSPTDTLVLAARAKVLMMLQSLISLVIVVVLAARAINTLQ